MTPGREFEFETGNFSQYQEYDEGEQNLDEEAAEMLRSWDRDVLLEEIRQEREKIKRDKENKEIDYYDGDTEFVEIQGNMEPLADGQVFIKIIESNPDGKTINGSSTILFDRIGYLEFELEPFESSVYDGKPSKLNLSEGPAACGMLLALTHLKEGERANILIKPSMAYGELGCPPLIPECASLFYHVKIYKVWDMSELDGLLQYEKDNYMQFPVEEKLKLVEDHKALANKYLKDDQLKDALVMYKAAIKCLEEIPEHNLRASPSAQRMMVILLQNACITMNRLSMHKSATKTAKRALFMDPTNIKAYYQLVKARICLDDFSGAINWIEKADRYFPNSSCFDTLRLQIDTQQRHERETRKEILKKMSRAIV